MAKKHGIKRELIEWGIIIAVALGLYISGYYVEVAGQLQRLFLYTGLKEPELITDRAERVQTDLSWFIRDTSGRVFPVSRFRGKVIFLNFWASWCPPCVAEMPGINSLYESTRRDSIIFLMVSLDRNRGDGIKFIRKKGFAFPVFFTASSLPATLESEVIPTTFVIDKEGRIAVRKEGLADYDNRSFKKALSDLLKE
jgi:thiol-disulfide isomerase/thioredoxin